MNLSKRFSQEKLEHENLLSMMQALSARNMNIRGACSYQIVMLHDILKSLKRKNESIHILESKIASVRNTDSSNEKSQSMHMAASRHFFGSDETPVLSVTLRDSGKRVVIYQGETIVTPMGEAVIVSIHPSAERVILRLTFGLLYANLRRLVTWGKSNANASTSTATLDATSDETLKLRWNQLDGMMKIPARIWNSISDILNSEGRMDGTQIHAQHPIINHTNIYNSTSQHSGDCVMSGDHGDATDNDEAASADEHTNNDMEISGDTDTLSDSATDSLQDSASRNSPFHFTSDQLLLPIPSGAQSLAFIFAHPCKSNFLTT